MKVLILGAGVIGVTTAHRLLKDGHEVTLIERNATAAEETSANNAGLVAPGHSYAWSSPKAPGILLKSLWRDDQALRFKLKPDPRLWHWSWLFLRQCNSACARRNTLRKHRLCMYAQQALQQTVAETGIDYDGRRGGLLYLYRSQETFDLGVANMGILADDGQELRAIDRDQAARIDPALGPVKDKFAGAIYCPSDESGDARKFTLGLAEVCAGLGARFLYGTTITGIETEGDQVTAVITDMGRETAEAYVLALGCESPILARRLGVRLPIYPVKGYSVTLPVAARNNPPNIGGVDEDNLTAYTRLGDRLRVTATAEFAGYDLSHKPSDFRHMLGVARDIFPEGADYEQPSYEACLRPMTPEGTPRFGLGPQRNLYYNTGHGHMGWTMACGAARITADLVAGRTPDIPLDGMTLQ
jgi:D-amino-acid dehydrogenase